MQSIKQITHEIEMERWRRENRQARIDRIFYHAAGFASLAIVLAMTIALALGIK